MPVQGLDSPVPDITNPRDPETSSGSSGQPDITKQEQPVGAGGAAGMPASIQNMANAGAMAGAGVPAGMGPLGGAGGSYSGLAGGIPTPGGFLGGAGGSYSGLGGGGPSGGGGAFAAGAGGAPEVAPGMEDFRLSGQGKGAIHDELRDAQTGEYQNFGGGLIGGQGGLTGVQDEGIGADTGASDEDFDQFAEARALYEQYMEDLEAERGALLVAVLVGQWQPPLQWARLQWKKLTGQFEARCEKLSLAGSIRYQVLMSLKEEEILRSRCLMRTRLMR